MKERIELWVFPSGNISVYRGSAYIPKEELTEEERQFVLNKVLEDLSDKPKTVEGGSPLEAEIKRYTEELYQYTFGHGLGTLNEFDWEDIAVMIEEAAVHFLGWKEKEYKPIRKILALGFMHFLDENRKDGMMCLSNDECEDIEKAFREQDWVKLNQYSKKYLCDEEPLDIEDDCCGAL